MQTVIIYDQCDANIKFLLVDGDYTRFNGVYINSIISENKKEQKAAEKLQDELNKLVYDNKTGRIKLPEVSSFPSAAVKDGAAVIVAGFLP